MKGEGEKERRREGEKERRGEGEKERRRERTEGLRENNTGLTSSPLSKQRVVCHRCGRNEGAVLLGRECASKRKSLL